jgi:hypothetical protein
MAPFTIPHQIGGGFVFIIMERWKELIESSSTLAEIIEIYMDIRMMLKELGHTEESIQTIHTAPGKLWSLRHKMTSKVEQLFSKISDYGFDITWPEFNGYLQPKLNNIDLLIPLNDGSKKRNNRRNKDN